MFAIASFFILLLPFTLGFLMLKSSNLELKNGMDFALSFPVGMGIISLWSFALCIMNISLSHSSINFPIFILLFFLYLKFRNRYIHSKFPYQLKFSCHDPLIYIFLAYILVHIIYLLWRNTLLPVMGWDAVSTHTFNAKVLFYERTLEYINNMPHSEYPLHVPLSEAWFNLTLGIWDDTFFKTIFYVYSLSNLLLLYAFLKDYVKTRWALLGVVLLLSSNFFQTHTTVAYREIVIMFYNISALFLLLQYLRMKNYRYLILAGFLSGMAAFVKFEGIGYTGIHAFICLLIVFYKDSNGVKEKIKTTAIFLCTALATASPFHIYRQLTLDHSPHRDNMSLNYNIGFELPPNAADQLINIINIFFGNMFYSTNWNIIWIILIFSILLLFRSKVSREIWFLLIAFASYSFIYLVGYAFTKHYYWAAETQTVMSRSILHYFSIIPALIILINFREEKD